MVIKQISIDKRHSNFKDITNEKFGNLLVISLAGFRKKKHGKSSKWLCECICGKKIIIDRGNLNRTKSCGCLRGAKTKDFNVHVQNIIYNSYFQKSKKRSLEFELTKDQLIGLVLQPCNYCGSEGLSETFYSTKRGEITGRLKHNGIDRINNEVGYIIMNCNPCCKVCNRAKNAMTMIEWNKWLNKLVKYRLNL